MAKFKINKIFTLTEQLPVYIQGEIIHGVIHIGDTIQLPLNTSLNSKGKICFIEFLDIKEDSFVCLGLECKSLDEQKFWLGMSISQGEEIEITINT